MNDMGRLEDYCISESIKANLEEIKELQNNACLRTLRVNEGMQRVWVEVALQKIRLQNQASLPKQKKNVDQEMHAC